MRDPIWNRVMLRQKPVSIVILGVASTPSCSTTCTEIFRHDAALSYRGVVSFTWRFFGSLSTSNASEKIDQQRVGAGEAVERSTSGISWEVLEDLPELPESGSPAGVPFGNVIETQQGGAIPGSSRCTPCELGSPLTSSNNFAVQPNHIQCQPLHTLLLL